MGNIDLYCHKNEEYFTAYWEFDSQVDCPMCNETHEVEWDYTDGGIAVWTVKN
jgi:hypothetical protein